MIVFIYICIISILLITILAELLQKDYLLHMAQLSNYRYFEYWNWLSKIDKFKIIIDKLVGFVIYIFINIFLLFIFSNIKSILSVLSSELVVPVIKLKLIFIIFYLIFILVNFAIFLKSDKKKGKMKKPLVYTKRAIRLKILYYIVFLSFLILLFLVFQNKITYFAKIDISNTKNIFMIFFFLFSFSLFSFIIFAFTPFLLLFCQLFILPLENKINSKYFLLAQKKIKELKDKGLIVIGITGSYGKTSTKFYIKSVLEKKINTLCSKQSYNTPMGLSKTINDELTFENKVYISEMGARYKNDISQLVDLCKPDIGVLTAIGPVHIETFKSIENIVEEKWKIIQNSKIGIINIDNDYIYNKFTEKLKNTEFKVVEKEEDLKDLYTLLNNEKRVILTYGSKRERNPFVLIKDINFKDEKTEFVIEIGNKFEYNFETRLLGKHSIENLTVAITLGYLFNIQYNDIFQAISLIEPVEHRLQLIKPNEMMLIIDDAFNSNPDSAEAAINVINQFKDKKKIIVTPGFIELGKLQYEKNYEFGKKIAENFDYAIFVGKTNKEALIKGFQSNGNSNFSYMETLDEASLFIPKLIDRKTVILFENDLPDNY